MYCEITWMSVCKGMNGLLCMESSPATSLDTDTQTPLPKVCLIPLLMTWVWFTNVMHSILKLECVVNKHTEAHFSPRASLALQTSLPPNQTSLTPPSGCGWQDWSSSSMEQLRTECVQPV